MKWHLKITKSSDKSETRKTDQRVPKETDITYRKQIILEVIIYMKGFKTHNNSKKELL